MENIALIRYFPCPFRFQFPLLIKPTTHPLELWDFIPGIAQGCIQSVCTAVAPDQPQLNPVLIIPTAVKPLTGTTQLNLSTPIPPPSPKIASVGNAETGVKEAIPVLSLACLCCCFFPFPFACQQTLSSWLWPFCPCFGTFNMWDSSPS